VTDTLSDVLRAVRLTGAVFFDIRASAPWVADSAPASTIAPHIRQDVEHVIAYHLVTAGSCWAGLLNEPAVYLEAGDLVVFPQGDPHVVSSAPGMRGGPDAQTLDLCRLPVLICLQGKGPEDTHVTCGFLGCDARPFNPLLATLPRMIHLSASQDAHTVVRHLVELAVVETRVPRPGSECVLARLSELLFIEVVRRFANDLPAESVGWFAGLRDQNIGRALQLLHERPAHAWGLDELAREIGLSRSVLAERFVHFVGIPPIQYLAQWRIQLAATQLRTTQSSIAEIAERVGYSSEAALSRAFKRCLGVAPAQYRRGAIASPLEDDG
jgi:AraC-like DNA-binding protein